MPAARPARPTARPAARPAVGADGPVEVFAALGDPTRQRLLQVLAGGVPPTTAELAATLAVTRQAVEKQLRVLERAGLVERQQQGRRASFAVRTETLAESGRWLAAVATEWDRRLAAVKALAESDPLSE